MRSHQFHSAENRRAVFAGLPAPIWLEKGLLQSWIVVEPSLILQILHSPHAAVPDALEILKAIEESHGVTFPNVAYACGVLPLMASDSIHPEARRGFATFLAARLSELDRQLPALSESCMAPLARQGPVDIVSEVVAPYIHGLFSALLGCNVPHDLLSTHVGDILSFSAGLGGLKRMDSNIAKTVSFLRTTTSSEQDIAWKFSLFVFGLDSMAMMLTESIVTALRDDPAASGARLPAFPLETGAPVTFRRARSNFEVGGCRVQTGDMMRLQLQSLSYAETAENRKFIFGAGMHSCIGKQMSLRIWDHFRREFDRLNLKARITQYELLPAHYVIKHKLVQLEVL